MKKINMPNIRALLPQPKPRKPRTRLQASASRLTQPVYDDYEDEPTTKLSTAFVVVLVLHLVAVGGIYAFHSIKAHRREADGTAVAANPSASKKTAPAPPAQVAPAQEAKAAASAPAAAPSAAPVSKQAVAAQQPAAVPASVAPTPLAQPAKSVASGGVIDKAQASAQGAPSAVLPQPKAPAATASTKAAAASSTEIAHRTYTVAKGDNPVSIAKKMGVSSEELLKLNGLEDPKKLQIGQVLKVPAKK